MEQTEIAEKVPFRLFVYFLDQKRNSEPTLEIRAFQFVMVLMQINNSGFAGIMIYKRTAFYNPSD